MGIEDRLRKEAEINVNDGTYIIDLDLNKVQIIHHISAKNQKSAKNLNVICYRTISSGY